MKVLISILLKALAIMYVLPAMNLLAFHGGLVHAILTVIVVAIAVIFVVLFLWPVLMVGVVGAVFGEAVIGDGAGRVASFIMTTIIVALSLWVATGMISGLVLLGFWPTMGAAAILALIGQLAA